MLVTITNRSQPATDLGFLLHKNPANLHTFELPFGKARVFYSKADPQECTACLLLDIDAVGLVRRAQQLEDYVNDRPYVASSYFSVALARVFGTALAGNCQRHPALVETKLALEIVIPVIRARQGQKLLKILFEPLGYQVDARIIPLDEQFPDWGESSYWKTTLKGDQTVHDALSHLYVLMPVLDDEKHYFVSDEEVSKLLRHGEGWLREHPARDLIVSRYLKRRAVLMEEAMSRLLEEEGAAVEEQEVNTEQAALQEKDLERPLTLHTQRLNLVATKLKELGAKTVLDLGCGEGKLLRRLLADRAFERVVGMDVSHKSLSTASKKLRLETMPERQRKRIELMHGSLLYRDKRLAGFDAAALIEVIEHLDPPRLTALERVVFEFAKPRHVVITTPNREYNSLFTTLPSGSMRHRDHRFEWTRDEFRAWASGVAERFRYNVAFEQIGPVDERLGAPSQMAVFSSTGGI